MTAKHEGWHLQDPGPKAECCGDDVDYLQHCI